MHGAIKRAPGCDRLPGMKRLVREVDSRFLRRFACSQTGLGARSTAKGAARRFAKADFPRQIPRESRSQWHSRGSMARASVEGPQLGSGLHCILITLAVASGRVKASEAAVLASGNIANVAQQEPLCNQGFFELIPNTMQPLTASRWRSDTICGHCHPAAVQAALRIVPMLRAGLILMPKPGGKSELYSSLFALPPTASWRLESDSCCRAKKSSSAGVDA